MSFTIKIKVVISYKSNIYYKNDKKKITFKKYESKSVN